MSKRRRNGNGERMVSVNFEPKNDRQGEFIRAISENDIVFCTGPSGTGKTFIPVAMAWQYLANKIVEKIVITRPVVETGEFKKRSLSGALPGDINDKMEPYTRPVFDEFKHFINQDDIDNFLRSDRIEVVPLAFMRGRNFYNSFIVLDEAQNCTEEELVLVLTRLCERSKLVIVGDVTQTDLPQKIAGTLSMCIDRLGDINGIGIVEFESHHIIRHPLIGPILEKLRGNYGARAH